MGDSESEGHWPAPFCMPFLREEIGLADLPEVTLPGVPVHNVQSCGSLGNEQLLAHQQKAVAWILPECAQARSYMEWLSCRPPPLQTKQFRAKWVFMVEATLIARNYQKDYGVELEPGEYVDEAIEQLCEFGRPIEPCVHFHTLSGDPCREFRSKWLPGAYSCHTWRPMQCLEAGPSPPGQLL